MARYRDAVCRLCRREGGKLFLKGDRCYKPSCPIEKRGTNPPGQHGGNQRRGKALAGYVIAEAKDGYAVVFSLGELDPDLGAARIVVADKRDGKLLFAYQGPVRLVVPADKEGARSVRMLEKLEVVKLRK